MPSLTPLAIGAEFLQNILNFGQVDKANKVQEEHAYQANSILEDQKGETSDVLGNLINKYKDPNYIKNAAGIPTYTRDDLDKYFSNSHTAASAFTDAYKPYDYSGLTDKVAGVINGGKLDPNDAAAQVGKFYDAAPIDTRAYLANELNKTSAASRAREQQARATSIQQGLSRGMNLQDMSGDLSNLALSEARARGQSATAANAAAEGLINKALLEKAGQQAHTWETQSGLNEDLVKALAAETSRIGTSDADNQLRVAEDVGKLSSEDITREDARKGAAWGAYNEMLDRYTDSAKFGATMDSSLTQLIEQFRTGLAGQQATNIMGQGYTIPNFNFGDQMMQYATSVAAAKAAAPPKVNPLANMFTLGLAGTMGGK